MNKDTFTAQMSENSARNMELIFGDFSFGDMVNDIARGTFSPDSGGLINNLLSLFLGELRSAFMLVGSIAALIIISSFLTNLNQSFGKKAVGDAAGFAIFLR